MQVTETLSEGLKRELKVVIYASDLESRLKTRIDRMKDGLKLKGFRPGKVPVAHIKKTYGVSMMQELLQEMIKESSRNALKERKERPASEPKVELPEDPAVMKAVMGGEADFEYAMSYEIIPDFAVVDFAKIELEKLVAKIPDEEVEEALEKLAADQKRFSPKEDGATAEMGDAVRMDFTGQIDGKVFDGGTAEDMQLELGSGRFIPGFEDQLVGVATGDEKDVTLTFPEDYSAKHLAGKEAVFSVKIKEVGMPLTFKPDDAFAASIGLESIDKLRENVRTQLENGAESLSKAKLKRKLLDALDEAHDFELPPNLLEQEFEGIWKQYEAEKKAADEKGEDITEGKSDRELRAEYHTIAERRVRLGLVLARIGEDSGVMVSDEEINAGIMRQARDFSGQEKQIFEFYQKNPNAVNQIRAPLYEEKVVDYILELAKVSELPVSSDELYKEDEDEDEDEASA